MNLSFVEALDFTDVVYEYFSADEFGAFQEALLANPERGAVMPGCGGLRKARASHPLSNLLLRPCHTRPAARLDLRPAHRGR